MSADVHVRFREHLGGRFPGVTRPVILCRGDSQPAMAVLETVLERLELTLNRDKTHVVDAREQAFNFLGFSIKWARSRRTGKGYPNVEPSKRAKQRIKARSIPRREAHRKAVYGRTVCTV